MVLISDGQQEWLLGIQTKLNWFCLKEARDGSPSIPNVPGKPVSVKSKILKRCLPFTQFGEGLFDEFGVLAAGCEIGMGGGPVLFDFPILLQKP